MRRRPSPNKIERLLFAFLFTAIVFGLAACSEQEIIFEPVSKYMYSFEAGSLVLRTENYSDVICADTINESAREALGFWPIVNTDSRQVHNGMLFQAVNTIYEGTLTSDVIKRYNERGIETILFRAEGSIRLITCEENCLYFYEHNSSEDVECYYRINDCFNEDFSVDCLAEIPTADDITSNSDNAFTKNGEWIYFLYTENPDTRHDIWRSPDIWLYKLSERTGVIEPVASVNNTISAKCREISAIAEINGNYVLEGIPQKSWQLEHGESAESIKHLNRIYYLYDVNAETCVLLCESAIARSSFLLIDGSCFHIHQSEDGSIYWAKTAANGEAQCEQMSPPMSDETSHFTDISEVTACGNSILYNAYADDKYIGYYTDFSSNKTQQMVSPYRKVIAFNHNKVTYLYINGAVLYTDQDHSGQWFDSGIRVSPKHHYFTSDKVFFSKENDTAYLVVQDNSYLTTETISKEFNEIYECIKINTDFEHKVDPQSPIFDPDVTFLKPHSLEGAFTPKHTIEDKYGNSFLFRNSLIGDSSDDNVLYDIAMLPFKGSPNYAKYSTNGQYLYMAGVIGISTMSYYNSSGLIRIYADKELVFETPLLSPDTEPIEFFININNAIEVTVEAVSDDASTSQMTIDSLWVVIDDVSFQNIGHPLYLRYLNGKEVFDENSDSEAGGSIEDTTNEAKETGEEPNGEHFLIQNLWYSEGYRLSDSWIYIFYSGGKYLAINEAGAEPSKGEYSLTDGILTLDHSEKRVYVYNEDSGFFVSTTDKKLAEQAYVDDDGVLHEAVYEYRCLEKKQ